MIVEKYLELASLSIADKRLLINELCQEIASIDEESPDPNIVKILEERWASYEENPTGAMTLEEFRKRIGAA
ncbi:MAG: addiction module protein [Verrucomicrobiae bacterium]|nr:addiction module protein [Verrucomicrobiae bacterium]